MSLVRGFLSLGNSGEFPSACLEQVLVCSGCSGNCLSFASGFQILKRLISSFPCPNFLQCVVPVRFWMDPFAPQGDKVLGGNSRSFLNFPLALLVKSSSVLELHIPLPFSFLLSGKFPFLLQISSRSAFSVQGVQILEVFPGFYIAPFLVPSVQREVGLQV